MLVHPKHRNSPVKKTREVYYIITTSHITAEGNTTSVEQQEVWKRDWMNASNRKHPSASASASTGRWLTSHSLSLHITTCHYMTEVPHRGHMMTTEPTPSLTPPIMPWRPCNAVESSRESKPWHGIILVNCCTWGQEWTFTKWLLDWKKQKTIIIHMPQFRHC